MWELACDYFKSVDERPFLKQEQRKTPIKIERGSDISPETLREIKNPVVEIETIRPYTWTGFEAYLYERGVLACLDHYKCNLEGRYTDYVEIVRVIQTVMFAQKFEGAAVGAFNASIISRDLGLVDKSQIGVVKEQPLFGDGTDD